MDDSRKTLYWGIATFTGSIFLAYALSPLYLRDTMTPFVGLPTVLLLLGINLPGMCRVSYLFYRAKRTVAAWLGLFGGIIAIALPTWLVIHYWRMGLENQIILQSIEAAETVRMLNWALAEYQSKYGHLPATLAVLGPPPVGVTLQSEETAALIDIELARDLARGERHGYRFTYTARDTHGNGTLDAFTMQANPVVPEEHGMKKGHYFSDSLFRMHWNRERPAGPNDLEY